MRNKVRQVESGTIAIEDQPIDILIERNRRAVRAHQRLLVHANRSRIERRLSVLCLSEQNDASTRPDRVHRDLDQGIAANRKQSNIGPAAIRGSLRMDEKT